MRNHYSLYYLFILFISKLLNLQIKKNNNNKMKNKLDIRLHESLRSFQKIVSIFLLKKQFLDICINMHRKGIE